MPFKDVLVDIPFQPDKKKKNKCVAKETVRVEKVVDTSDISYIKKSISEILAALNGDNYDKDYTVKVTQSFKINDSRKCCFRATVIKKYDRKVLVDFFIEKVNNEEYVFSPPLNISAFTVNSYENRNSVSKN